MTTTERLCRSSMYIDAGIVQHHGDREVRCGKPHGHAGSHAEYDQDGAEIAAWLPAPGPSVSGQPTPKIVSGEYDDAAAQHDALVRAAEQARAENARLRSQLAEARERAATLEQQRNNANSLMQVMRDGLDRAGINVIDGDTVDDVAMWVSTPIKTALADRDSLREERDRLVAELRERVRRAPLYGFWEFVNAVDAALAATAPQPSPAEPHGCDDQCTQAAEHGLHPPVRDECCGDCGPGLCDVDARNGEEFTGRGAEPPAAPVQPEERRDEDWTAHEGRSNSSPEFRRLEAEIERLIRNSAHDLIAGRAHVVAGLILAQLAHKQGMVPASVIDEARAALATAERERDEAREQWRIEIGLRQALGANYDALRAEVQRIAAEHDAAHPECAPFGTTISNDLRAALGSTPDTPQEA